MPKQGSDTPPEVMTWPRARLVLALCVVFDVVRLFFALLVFLGPAMAAFICTHVASDYVGTTVGAVGCGAAATVGGVALAPITIGFGEFTAMALGFAGWLLIGGILMWTNRRIFSASAGNLLWFVGGLVVDEVPFVDAIPSLTLTVWKMYADEIKSDEAALAKWQEERAAEEHAADELAEQRAEEELLMQVNLEQVAEDEAEAANDASISLENNTDDELRDAA